MVTTKQTVKAYSAELRERVVRTVREYASEDASEWAAMRWVAEKTSCRPETLWMRQAERDRDEQSGLSTDDRARLTALEREVSELRQAKEILRKASAFFAAVEFDRGSKP